MTAMILDGKKVASHLKTKLKSQIATYTHKGLKAPGLAVILVGDDKASALYVSTKRKTCAEVGITSFAYNLPTQTSEAELLSLIAKLNHQEEVDGILVQLPLPKHIETTKIIESIAPQKDVDGFHPYNLGRLTQANPILRPCTPYGVIQLLNAYQIPLKRQNAVVIGSSNIVGRPMSLELLMAGATVTICHSQTKNLEPYVRHADIVISATGVRHLIQNDWLHSQQTLIDVGMHRLDDGRICGDIDFDEAQKRVAAITPVPGGVGPMTVVTLLQNTFEAYRMKLR